MKNLLLFTFTLFLFDIKSSLCQIESTQFPTFADPPTAENVLVVYRIDHPNSSAIKDHYVDIRSIPSTNVVPINLSQSYPGISFTNSDEVIVGEGNLGWQYVKERIADEIENHLNTTYYNGQLLRDLIRYIVVCKGIPFKIWDTSSNTTSYRTFVSVDALLCLINQSPNKSFLDLYNTSSNDYPNPYFGADPTFTLNYRFDNNHFEEQGYKMQYLVSRLEGHNYQDVINLIDRSIIADMTGEKIWVMDSHDAPGYTSDITSTYSMLSAFDFNFLYDGNLPSPVINEPIVEAEDSVIGYISMGANGYFNGHPTYILDRLFFDYAPGAIFNSIESFNCISFLPDFRNSHGLVSDFINMGGTGGGGNAWEPYSDKIYRSNISFPSYGFGYNLVDAIYLGIPYLGFVNVVVGDPLTKIYNPTVETLPDGYTFSSGDYYGHYYVPEGSTVYINSSGTINFNRNSSLEVDGALIIQPNAHVNFYSYTAVTLRNATFTPNSNVNYFGALILDGDIYLSENFELNIPWSGKLFLTENCQLHFINNSRIKMSGSSQLIAVDLTMQNNSEYIFEGQSNLTVKNLVIENGAKLNFNSDKDCIVQESLQIQGGSDVIFRKLKVKNLSINPGSSVSFNSGFANIGNSFIANGQANNRIILTLNNNYDFDFEGSASFQLSNCDWQGGSLQIRPRYDGDLNVSIVSSSFSNCVSELYIGKSLPTNNNNISINLSNNTFSNFPANGLNFYGLESALILNNSFNSITSVSLVLADNKYVRIDNCQFRDGNKGIIINLRELTESQMIPNSKVEINNTIFENLNFGIEASMQNLSTLYIKGNTFSVNDAGILVSQFTEPTNDLAISSNQITIYKNYGMHLTLGNTAIVEGNNITVSNNSSSIDQLIGIYIDQVTNPVIINNTIVGTNLFNPGPGLFLASSNGQIRKNTIMGHLYGIELGGSSPDLAQNTIRGNKSYGLYVSAYSFPNLSQTIINNEKYPLTGYNNIYENGSCDGFQESVAEIFISRSSINLQTGCNQIADDRYEPRLNCDHKYLINGEGLISEINAQKNYWGNHPIFGNDPGLRFGDEMIVDYEGFLNERCEYSGGGSLLLVRNNSTFFVDSVYSNGSSSDTLSELETKYSVANGLFYTYSLTEAKGLYNNIVQDYGTQLKSSLAFNRLYEIENAISNNPSSLIELNNYYQSKISSFQDSTLSGAVLHLSDLCLVSAGEYIAAIQNFDEIVQQNPNTDVAFYNELDAITTARLIDSTTSLGKVSSKYISKSVDDYKIKVKNLFNKRRGINIENSVPQIPTKFELYQNYPNPFNPVTTIKFDLPKDGLITLEIFDILGRRIATLINEYRTAGSYNQVFNASSLASGVYVYKLQAGDFVSSKKMILLK